MTPAANRLEEDRLARTQALEIASFIVEAPAGAGKTELLTQRYLRLLAAVDQPEEVLALTFTNKAATEMRDRILGSLERAARGEVPDQPHKRLTFDLANRVLAHDAANGWQLLGHPGRLRITTIDALCASLARQMPFLSRFGSQPGVAEDAEAHYATAARRTLEMLEAETPDADIVAAALASMDNNAGRLENLLTAMLGRRDQWLQHTSRIKSGAMKPEVEAGFAALIERDLAAACRLLDAGTQARLMPLARFAAANVTGILDSIFDWNSPLTATVADLRQWQAVACLLLTGGGTLRKTVDKRIGFPADKEFADQKKAMLELLGDLRGIGGLEDALGMLLRLPQPELSEAEWATVECFSRLLRLAAGQLWLAFQEAGEVDFIEIAARARLALGDDEAPTDLAQALDYRIRHLLVDEFQDTSPSQVELIEKLTRGWMPDDGRTLFVVGDPMQSIYRFRKAARAWPVNGRFSAAQRDLYQLVLAAQDAAFAMVRPGAHFIDYHDAAVRVLAQGFVDLKMLAGSVDSVIEQGTYKRFYMHRTGHWLGMDVHDAGEYRARNEGHDASGQEWRMLEAGMVLTVEPGCYVRPADDVPEAFWNIGIRIEDDVLVTADGCDIYTVDTPKTVADIEAVMAEART